MFYKMIEKKCQEWYISDDCTVKDLIQYIVNKGEMRDAQIEAIKIYLFLKIAHKCQPLNRLFIKGAFNSINLDDLALSVSTREYLENNPAAAALFEYATLKNDKGEQVSEKIEKQISKEPSAIKYDEFFDKVFYNVNYTDYLFSLPMGAGKTYLMAAFIYLDLYFAMNEPDNKAFAHNFIIFAPSGLKSSVVPSLKTIQRFNPAWIIPEPAASDIKRIISFEVLDQNKTASKSNKTKNPNVQKIANHQPLSELFGLVAVTNAEKVILDRIKEKNGMVSLFEESDDDKDRQANELRNLIGKLPSLSIFIDEVHHAVSDDIKLRAVATKWANNYTINSVIGFSGTPYLSKAEKIDVTSKLKISNTEISNIVYYYPLIDGIGNFLKRPTVKIVENATSTEIIGRGIRAFLNEYKDTIYDDGTVAKLGIYCGTIEKLEKVVYPLAAEIANDYGIGTSAILKFHKGNKQYAMPADSQLQFDTLDSSVSNIRIVLLVQIGKEGWDCRSLTGIILSQEGDCPTNMVLQTSCRCLRQVSKGVPETALIYLNADNAEKLNMQLEQQHHITIQEFQGANNDKTKLNRYDRTGYLKLPKIDFYQLKINYDTLVIEEPNPAVSIPVSVSGTENKNSTEKTTDFEMDDLRATVTVDDEEHGCEYITFNSWVYDIMRQGFGSPTIAELKQYEDLLRAVFDTITYEMDGSRYFSSKYQHAEVEANIRKTFYAKRDFSTVEEVIPEKASLLNIANFKSEIFTDDTSNYYPSQNVVENIVLDDKGKFKGNAKVQQTITTLEEIGQHDMAEKLRRENSSHPKKDHSFHYLPYKTDSDYEQAFLEEVLMKDEIESLGLEVYYNGDKALTEFKIKCYKKSGGKWNYIGKYTPDFLIIKRKDGAIHKAIIVETKGQIYANDPTFVDKRRFMETEFVKQNNSAFGYERFDYLYLEDTMTESERITITHNKIKAFFEE